MRPEREIVDGECGPEAEALVDRLRACVRDVLYVRLDDLEPGFQLRFLRWLVARVETTEWETLLVESRPGEPLASGLTRSGRVVSLDYYEMLS